MKRINPVWTGTYWANIQMLDEACKTKRGNLHWQILEHLNNNDTVLDVGSGSGMIICTIRDVIPNVQCSVCDREELAVSYLRDKKIFKEAFQCDITEGIRKPDKSYDVVICTEVLEHLEDPAICIKELVRLARRKVIITVPYKLAVPSDEHVWEFNFDDIFSLLSPYGFVYLSEAHGHTFIVGACYVREP